MRQYLVAYAKHTKTTCAPNSVDDACGNAERFVAWLESSGHPIDKRVLGDYALYRIEHGAASRSVATFLSWVRHYVAFCEANDFTFPKQLRVKLPRPNVKIRYTPTDALVENFLRESESLSQPYGTVLALLPLTGARDSEMSAHPLDDVEMIDGRVIFHFKNPKNGHDRQVPLLKRGNALFGSYMTNIRPELVGRKRSPWLFPRVRNVHEHLTHTDNERYWREVREKLGFPAECTAHAFRRYYVRLLMRNGVPAAQVAKLIGHRNLQTFDLYYNPTAEELVDITKTLDGRKDLAVAATAQGV